MQGIYCLIIGAVAGVFSGFFGIGGGVVIVPFLIFVLGFSQVAANGTSLVALLLPVGALGVYEYVHAGKINMLHIRCGLIIALGIFIGTYFGSRFAIAIPEKILRKAFSGFLFVIALRLWFLQR